MITRVLTAAVALLAPLAAFGTLGIPATAHADAGDAQFLALLKSEGITDHVSTAHAIEAGHAVCEKLGEGLTPTEVADDVIASSSLPAYHSGYFVSAAVAAYCPEYTAEAPKPDNA